MPKLTIKDFNQRYPDSEACLMEVARQKFGTEMLCPKYDCGRKLYRKKGRKSWQCNNGHETSPLVGTIFQGSRTDLKTWFFVIYMMSQTRAGVSAMHVMRMTGLTYKCAWRMMHAIRNIMNDDEQLNGEVEADETYFRPNTLRDTRVSKPPKMAVLGFIERGTGRVKVRYVEKPTFLRVNQMAMDFVQIGSTVITDGSRLYNRLTTIGYQRESSIHWSIAVGAPKHMSYFLPSQADTQLIENFWGVLKRGFKGTYIHCAPHYMQLYADEYAWRYSNRKSEIPMFELLLERV